MEEHSTPPVMQSKETRKTWTGDCEYILSLFGYLSGAGDFWRFPYLFWKNGGASFMIAFLFAIMVCSVPIYYLELAISQYSGKGMYDVWCICPLFSGLCITTFIINVEILLIHPTVRVWIMSYIRHSFQSILPWTSCGNSWNTDTCVDDQTEVYNITNVWNSSLSNSAGNRTVGNGSVSVTTSSEEEFWRYELLKESSGIEDIGGLNWELVIYNFVLRGIVVLCVIKSVKSIGKVMYVTTIIPFLLLLTVWVRSLTLPGSKEGFFYFIELDPVKFIDKQMWMEAGFAALNTLAIGMGGTLVIGSRGKFHTGIFRSTICVCALDVFGSVFTSVVLFSVLGVMAAEQHKPVSSVIKSGTSVGFVGFTRAFSYLPIPKVWSVLFFCASFIAVLDVVVLTKEVVVYFIMQWIPFCRKKHTFVVIAVFISSFILSLPFFTQAGAYIFQITDWYYGSWCVLITALCETFICMWIFGGHRIDDILRAMIGRPMPCLLRVCAAFVCPVVFMIFLITSIVLFRPPTYGNYHYPEAAKIFGYCLGIVPVIPIPIVMIAKIYRLDGPLLKRTAKLLKPSKAWGPVERGSHEEGESRSYEQPPLSERVFYNLTGRYRTATYSDKSSAEEMTSMSL